MFDTPPSEYYQTYIAPQMSTWRRSGKLIVLTFDTYWLELKQRLHQDGILSVS